MRRCGRFVGVVAVIGLLLSGCGGSDDSEEQPGQPTHPPTGETAAPAQGPKDAEHPDDHGLLAAAKTTLRKLPHSSMSKIDWDGEDKVWEVSVVYKNGKRKELDLSADGSQIKEGPRQVEQQDVSKTKWRKRLKASQLDYATAYDKVVAARTGWVTELRLDEYRNKPAWEAEMKSHGASFEITINARSGDVMENEAD